jgi:hypothetical protein
MPSSYLDPDARDSVTTFNAAANKSIQDYSSWIGTCPNGWGTDFNYLLGSGTYGLLPMFQDDTLKTLSLIWDPCMNTTDQWTMKNIIAGDNDTYITTIANECKAFGYPIYMRFGAEMNIQQSGGSTWATNSADYIDAWQHVVDIFRAQGVINVYWVWNPNCLDIGPNHWTDYYPGDTYVDLVGIDLYQYEDTASWCRPDTLMSGVYNDYNDTKPIAICEWGTNAYFMTSIDTPDADRAQWMTEFFNAVEARPQVKMISYFYWDHFQFATAPLTLAVYQDRIADPRYIGS